MEHDHRLQLDFLIPTYASDEQSAQSYVWDPSPTASVASSGSARIVELSESASSASPDPSAFDESSSRKSSNASKSGSSSAGAAASNRKGRGKQAFRHRKSHIKSKNGCFSCKDRRVKVIEHSIMAYYPRSLFVWHYSIRPLWLSAVCICMWWWTWMYTPLLRN
jgi:hypothetical protein